MKAIDEDMTILLGLHAHPGWLIDKCAACQASKRIMERFRELEAELAVTKANLQLRDTTGYVELKARAEQAEAERDALACDHEPCDHEEENEPLKARVAELEEVVELWETHGSLHSEDCPDWRRVEQYRLTGFLESREREAKR